MIPGMDMDVSSDSDSLCAGQELMDAEIQCINYISPPYSWSTDIHPCGPRTQTGYYYHIS